MVAKTSKNGTANKAAFAISGSKLSTAATLAAPAESPSKTISLTIALFFRYLIQSTAS